MARTACGLEEHECAVHIGLYELSGCLARAIDVRLSGKVDEDIAFCVERVDGPRIADVALDEVTPRLMNHRSEVGQVAGIRELVEHRHDVIRVLTNRGAHGLA